MLLKAQWRLTYLAKFGISRKTLSDHIDIGEMMNSTGLYDRYKGFGFKSGTILLIIQKSWCWFTPMGSLITLNYFSPFCSWPYQAFHSDWKTFWTKTCACITMAPECQHKANKIYHISIWGKKVSSSPSSPPTSSCSPPLLSSSI